MFSYLRFVPILAILVTACAPGSPAGQGPQVREGQPPASSGPKSITIAINEDPGNFWSGITSGGGSGARQLGHLVNQYLVALQSDATPQPRLLAEVPAVDKGTWRVLPDGKMEVTYRLRPGVVWHDGTAFTADDVVFSWQVNRDPAVPNANQEAVELIENIEARDATTAVATWSELYPFADRLEHRELVPLPKHLLERQYREAKDQLVNQPYFSTEYVGTGPYRVERWQQGSHLDLVAFDRYFLGQAKIDRIRVQFISDENAVVASLQAGAAHTFLPSGGPSFEQFMVLKREWDSSNRGTLLNESVRWFFAEAQKWPERNPQPAALMDARARQALLHALDRQELSRAMMGDLGILADSWVHPSFPYYSQVQPALTRYAHDPRRASEILGELGWRRGADGVLERGAEKFNVQIRYDTDNELPASVMRDGWKEIGVNTALEFRSEQMLRDRQARASFTGFDLSSNPMGGLSAVRRFHTEAIPTPDNRWTGTNRGGYSNPGWDDIGRRMRETLDDNARIQQERDLVRIFSTDLPVLPINYEVQLVPVAQGLTGVQPIRGIAHTGHVMHTWNVHEWDFSR